MNEVDYEKVLQVTKRRYERAWEAFQEADYEGVDNELIKLRDVLDDIYDPPDPRLIEQPRRGSR